MIDFTNFLTVVVIFAALYIAKQKDYDRVKKQLDEERNKE